MKTSRILCFLFVLSAFSANAFGRQIQETNYCYSEAKQGIDYTVYFENARPRPNEADMTYRQLNQTYKADCVDDLEQTLGNLRAANQDNCIILLGTADKKNDQQQGFNTELSIRRVSMIYKMLTSALQHNDCIRAFAGGASNSYFDSDSQQKEDDYEERVVRVIITKKDVTPQEGVQEITLNITNNITTTTNNTLTSMTSVVLDNRKTAALEKRMNISSVVNELNRMNDNFGRSHWKTASGNFNGARLASDSIAGVVLGTAGGLITSNIIKKNQLSSGFEDLQCVIAGQVVAGYKDDFTTKINLPQ